ncbi:MAG: recombinase family protein [Lachnospiraceae bacterium]|nr:recombinase family protein [Lachnospiraceae bacterium]
MKISIIESKPKLLKKKVAAYCRVSTEHDEQEDSLENQISHYENEIRSNPDYEFVEVYYDFGISGFKEERPGFQRMLQDAKSGRIDLIITKSISRFARNTETILKTSRELKEYNVAIYFELQGINTLTSDGELMMTVYAAFAQAESESTSELCKMSYRRKYEAGIPVQYLEKCFGYDKDDTGEFIIKEDEAKWVRKIFNMIANGYTAAAVKRYLNDNGIRTTRGAKWLDSTVYRVLRSEIYKGDYIMHKSYVNEDRRLVVNYGEVDSWYIENDHVPIVSKRLWQKAQDALDKRQVYRFSNMDIKELNSENYPYKDHIFCAYCGQPLKRRVYSNGNRVNWGCSGHKRFGKEYCKGINVLDSTIKDWSFDGDIYIYEKSNERGLREYDYYKESYWKRYNKKKVPENKAPELNEENYPYWHKLHCGICGCRLTRVVNTKTGRVTWMCNYKKHKAPIECSGTRIFDEDVKKLMPIDHDIYITERRKPNGEKCYTYSCQAPVSHKGKEGCNN